MKIIRRGLMPLGTPHVRRSTGRAVAAGVLGLGLCMGLCGGSDAQAQTGTSSSADGNAPPAKPAAKPTPKSADKPGEKSAEKPGDKSVRSAARRATAAGGAAAAATAAASALAAADDDQRQAFSLTHLGDYACEFKRVVHVHPHPVHEGYVDLHFDRRVVTARPVLSSTGAIRLEDVRGQFVMLQIAFKSMLLDTRSGQRVADECLHARHHEARQAAAEAPAQPGLGISNATR